MRPYAAWLVFSALALAGCGGSGSALSVPSKAPAPASASVSPASAATSRFDVPKSLALRIPPPPPARTPAKPSSAQRSPVASAAHASFFAGEAALSNGVYYLALPNGNVFGYYSYLSDSNYIYHFDMGYEYVVDANDGQGGVYLYDFASSHWWYTGRNYPFPYIYDFSLQSFLYYYPDTQNAGRYTTNPRYFYDFTANHIITLPGSFVLSSDPLYFTGSDQPCTVATPAPGAASATQCYPLGGGAGGGGTTIQEDFNEVGGASPPYTITSDNPNVATGTVDLFPGPNQPTGLVHVGGHGAGSTLMTLTASNGQQVTYRATVTVLNLGIVLNNLPTARSITLTTRYKACPFNDRVETFDLSSSTPNGFTYNLVNFPTYLAYVSSVGTNNLPTITSCPLFRFVVTVSDGANTIATKTVIDFLTDGTLNNQTISLP